MSNAKVSYISDVGFTQLILQRKFKKWASIQYINFLTSFQSFLHYIKYLALLGVKSSIVQVVYAFVEFLTCPVWL